MNYRMKYVIIETHMCAVPIVFSELQQHSDVAHAFARQPGEGETYKDVIIGAGFCIVNADGMFQCYGESISLNVKSRGEPDSKFLNKYFGITPEY